MEGNTFMGIKESIDNGTFKRQHKSVVVYDRDGNVISDNALKDNEGVSIINEKQMRAYRKKMAEENAMREHIMRNEGGDFVHLMFSFLQPVFIRLEERCKGNKANIHIIRFIILATHINYENNLYDNNRNRIKKSGLSKIWRTENNRKSVSETYNILKEEGFIRETEEGYIMINNEIIKKGNMDDYEKLMKKDFSKSYTRLFSENIQQIYNDTEPRSRKQLANLFKIIPYINFKYNVFCENPTEIDNKKLKYMTWTDLARLCGYEEKKNIAKFKKDLFNLSINGSDVIGEFKTKSGYKLVVNPKIYYSGTDIEDVKYLYSLFEMPIS